MASTTPNLNELLVQFSKVFSTMLSDPEASQNVNDNDSQNWIELLGEIKNLRVEGKFPQGAFDQSYSKEKGYQSFSKLLRELASSKNHNIQQKFGNLCLHLEEVLECLPKIQSTLSSLSSLQVKLDYSLTRFHKTLREARQLYQTETANIQCIEKRIKNPPPPLNMNVINTPQYQDKKFLFPFPESRKNFHVEKREEVGSNFHTLIEELPPKRSDMPILSAFDMVFKEIKYQGCEGYIVKKEHLMSSNKLELNYITIKHNLAERSGFLVQGSGHVLFVLPSNDIWQLFKAMAKGDDEKCLENFFVPLLTQNQIYKVEMNDAKSLKAFFTPLQKI